jgi:hypothetical protein
MKRCSNIRTVNSREQAWLLKNSLPEKCSEKLCVRKPYNGPHWSWNFARARNLKPGARNREKDKHNYGVPPTFVPSESAIDEGRSERPR